MPSPKPQPADEPKIERWTAQRKAAIIVDVLKGKARSPYPRRAESTASRKASTASGPTNSCAVGSMR